MTVGDLKEIVGGINDSIYTAQGDDIKKIDVAKAKDGNGGTIGLVTRGDWKSDGQGNGQYVDTDPVPGTITIRNTDNSGKNGNDVAIRFGSIDEEGQDVEKFTIDAGSKVVGKTGADGTTKANPNDTLTGIEINGQNYKLGGGKTYTDGDGITIATDDNNKISVNAGDGLTFENPNNDENKGKLKVNVGDGLSITDGKVVNNFKVEEDKNATDGSNDNWTITDGKKTFTNTTLVNGTVEKRAIQDNAYGSDYLVKDTDGNTATLSDVASATKLKEVAGEAGKHTTVEGSEHITVTPNEDTTNGLKYTITAEGLADTDLSNMSTTGITKVENLAKGVERHIAPKEYNISDAGDVTMTYVDGNGEEVSGMSATIKDVASRTYVSSYVENNAEDIVAGANNLTVKEDTTGGADGGNWQIEDSKQSGKIFKNTTLVNGDVAKESSTNGYGNTYKVTDTNGNIAKLTDVASATKLEEVAGEAGKHTTVEGSEHITVTPNEDTTNGLKYTITAEGLADTDLSNMSTTGITKVENLAKGVERHIAPKEYNISDAGDVTMTYVDGNGEEVSGMSATIKDVASRTYVSSYVENNAEDIVAGANNLTVKEDTTGGADGGNWQIEDSKQSGKIFKNTTLVNGDVAKESSTNGYGNTYKVTDTNGNIAKLTDVASATKLEEVAGEAGKHTTIQETGKNVTVETNETEDGHLDYTVNLNDDVTLGNAEGKNIHLDGNNGNITATGSVNAGGTIISSAGLTAGDVKVNAESATVTGLSNTTWNKDYKITTGQAATEDQLQAAVQDINKNSYKGWNVTTNKGTKTAEVASNGSVDFSNNDKNIIVGQDGTNLTFDLNDNITLGDESGTRIQLNGNPQTDSMISITNKDSDTVFNIAKDGTVHSDGDIVAKADSNKKYSLSEVGENAVRYNENKSTVALAGTNGTTITNVADGDVSEGSKEAVNGSQLYATNQKVDAGWVATDGANKVNVNPDNNTLKFTGDDKNNITVTAATDEDTKENSIKVELSDNLNVANVNASGDVTTPSADGTKNYSLKNIGKNTEAIYGTKVNGEYVTTVTGTLAATTIQNTSAKFRVDESGNVAAGKVIINATGDISGLSNTTWNGTTNNPSRAATEGQLKAVSDDVNAGWIATDNSGKEVAVNPDNNKLNFAGDDNITVTATTDENNNNAINVKLNDNITLGDGQSAITLNGSPQNSDDPALSVGTDKFVVAQDGSLSVSDKFNVDAETGNIYAANNSGSAIMMNDDSVALNAGGNGIVASDEGILLNTNGINEDIKLVTKGTSVSVDSNGTTFTNTNTNETTNINGGTINVGDRLMVEEDGSIYATNNNGSTVMINDNGVALNSEGNGVVVSGEGITLNTNGSAVTVDRFNGATFTNTNTTESTNINGANITAGEGENQIKINGAPKADDPALSVGTDKFVVGQDGSLSVSDKFNVDAETGNINAVNSNGSAIMMNDDSVALNASGNGVVISDEGITLNTNGSAVTVDRFNGATFTNTNTGETTNINGGTITTNTVKGLSNTTWDDELAKQVANSEELQGTAATQGQLQQAVSEVAEVANAGWNAKAGGNTINVKPNETLNFEGDGNITVSATGGTSNELKFGLNDDITLGNPKAGNTEGERSFTINTTDPNGYVPESYKTGSGANFIEENGGFMLFATDTQGFGVFGVTAKGSAWAKDFKTYTTDIYGNNTQYSLNDVGDAVAQMSSYYNKENGKSYTVFSRYLNEAEKDNPFATVDENATRDIPLALRDDGAVLIGATIKGDDFTDNGIRINAETETTYDRDGNEVTNNIATITGLENTEWKPPTPVATFAANDINTTSRAATEAQLDDLYSAVAAYDVNVDGTIDYSHIALAGAPYGASRAGNGTPTGGTSITNVAYASGKDGSEAVNVDYLNDAISDAAENGSISTSDQHLVANTETGSNGVYKPNDDGNVNLIVSDEKGNSSTITIGDVASKEDLDNLKDDVGDLDYSKVEGDTIIDGDSVTDAIGKLDNKIENISGTATDADNNTVTGGKINSDGTISLTQKDKDSIKLEGQLTDSGVVQEGTSFDKETGTITITSQDKYSGETSSVKVEGIASTEVVGATNKEDLATAYKDADKDGNATTEYITDSESMVEADVALDHAIQDVANTSYANDMVLSNRIDSVEKRLGNVEERIDKVGAMAAAIANLRTMGFDPEAPTEIAIGVGQYKSETGIAIGVFHYPNQDFMLSASLSSSGDELMGGIGATWKLGRKSAAERAKDEEARHLEQAEEMKKLAQQEKVKAQAQRHAKLLAERQQASQKNA